MEWSSDKNYWSTVNEFRTTIIDLQGMKLEQQPLLNREWCSNNNYWSTWNEVRTATIDQEGMKLEQQLLINREWN